MNFLLVSRLTRAAMLAVLCMGLSGCFLAAELSQVGRTPALSPIGDPAKLTGPTAISFPQPVLEPEFYAANSLWRNGARAFFNDQRAKRAGDILTVRIDIDDNARLENSTERSRSSNINAGIDNFFGLESQLSRFLPNAVNPGSLVGAQRDSTLQSDGEIDRQEEILLTVAVVVTQVLPNGNLVIAGRQEVRVNNEKRELLVSGVIRPVDIDADNTIPHTQIAEARISYGGKGVISNIQRPGYGQEAVDILFPF